MSSEMKSIKNIRAIKPQRRNANRHSQRGMGQLERSVQSDGWIGAITVAADGETFDGSARVEVASAVGFDDVIVVESDGTRPIVHVRTDIPTADDPRAARLGIAANRIAQTNLEWDTEVLAALAEDGVDLAAFWQDDELDELLGSLANDAPKDDPGAQVDRAEELREKWQTERGQFWQIGRHRLLCGDSTNADDVARLMGGRDVDGIFTSPPYDQQRTYESNMAADWHGLMVGVFGAALPHLQHDAQVFVNLGLIHRDGRVIQYWNSFIAWMEDNGQPLFGWYVWDKQNGMPGDWSGRLAPAHEWVFHFTRCGVQPTKTVATRHVGSSVGRSQRNPDGTLKRFTGERDPIQPFKIPDSVIRVGQQRPDELINNHPAPFPVDLPSVFLNAWNGRLWYEPFTGSATTFVAAEQCGSDVVGMEIEPKYIAVALERMSGMGLEPRRLD